MGRNRERPSLRRESRLVFVIGAPRSGTTFLAGALGAQPGLVDLGEVKPIKAAIPGLAKESPGEAAKRFRRTLDVVRTLGLAGHLRGVEQTPETSFVIEAALLAYPAARAVHIVRDGRDVVCSLLERGWLAAERTRRGRRRPRLRRPRPLLGRARARRRVPRGERSAPRRVGLAPLRHRRPDGERADARAPLRRAGHGSGGCRRNASPRFSIWSRSPWQRRSRGPSTARWDAGNASCPTDQVKDVEEEAGDLLKELGYL